MDPAIFIGVDGGVSSRITENSGCDYSATLEGSLLRPSGLLSCPFLQCASLRSVSSTGVGYGIGSSLHRAAVAQSRTHDDMVPSKRNSLITELTRGGLGRVRLGWMAK